MRSWGGDTQQMWHICADVAGKVTLRPRIACIKLDSEFLPVALSIVRTGKLMGSVSSE